MSRSHPPLQQHLLTRSDLARLGVPAGDILAWLARGAIEQVGTLAGDHGDDPVFTAAPELRADLTARLASIGKAAVVLSPLRVRSFLLRALLQRQTTGIEQPSSGVVDAMTPTDALAEHLAATDLAQVLHEAAAELEADVEHVLRIAEEEARLEATIGVAAGENLAQHDEPAVDSGGAAHADERRVDDASLDATDDEPEDEVGEEEACFDVDDLASALGEWDDEPAPTAVTPPADPPTAVEAPIEVAAAFDGVEAVGASAAGNQAAAARSADREAPPEPAPAPERAFAPANHGGDDAELAPGEPSAEAPSGDEPPADAHAAHDSEGTASLPQVGVREAPPATEAPIESIDVPPMPQSAGDADPHEPHVVDDVVEEAPEAAAALAAAPNREEPTMSAEPMATEHEDHPAAEQAASEAIANAEEALEPLLHDEDQPPTFDAKEIAAALSVLDLDAGPAKTPKAKAADPAAPAAANASVAATSTSSAPTESADAGSGAAVVPPAATHADEASQAAAAAAAAPNEQEPAIEAAPAKVDAAPALVDEVAAHATGATPPTGADDATPVLAASMQRVESFLGELKAALVEMAGRPQASPPPPTIQVPATPPVDLAPLVGAIEGGLQKSAASSAAAATALSGLAEKLEGIGQRIERSAVAAESMAQHAQAPKTNAEPARFLVTRSNPVPLTLLAVAAMVTAWSVLFWFKTGSPRLALGTLIGANLVGCVLLTPGRFR